MPQGRSLPTSAQPMRVVFRIADARKRLCRWDAVLGRRHRVPGATMAYGVGIPHDLVQYVIEAACGYEYGFWGLVARGATFKSTGRKQTKPGRQIIVEHRAELAASEDLAGIHLTAWQHGARTSVTAALEAAATQWRALSPDERLVFVWPSPTGHIEP